MSNNNFFKDLTNDNRLSRIFQFVEPNICSLNFWILELKHDNIKYYRLLYGLIVPSTVSKHDEIFKEWSNPKKSQWKSFKRENEIFKYRFIKISYFNTGYELLYLINELINGLNLGNACRLLRICHPTSAQELNIPVSNETKELYIIRPVIFLETKQLIYSFFSNALRSPFESAPAFMGSLFRLEKMDLFKIKESDLFTKELFKECSIYLKEETKLDFDGTESPRFGNIEFMTFPTLDENNTSSLVAFNPIKGNSSSTRIVNVKIVNEDITKDSLLIRCRMRNNLEIIFDECKECKVNKKILSVNFNTNEEIGHILVTIWKRVNNVESWKLVYENSNPLVKEIKVTSKIIRLSGKIKSKLAKQIRTDRNPSLKKRLDETERIEQGMYETCKINEYQFDPWVQESNEISLLTKEIFPYSIKDTNNTDIPEGYFFPKRGGDADPGILSLIEWLNSLTRNPETSKIIILDPYFDVFTINNLIAKTNSTNIEFIAITNTEIDSYDDAFYIDKRYNRIKIACKKLESVLPSLTIYNLTHKKKQKLHDRYILILDKDDNVTQAYNLSNSLERAMENYPLLITPIPFDLYNKVDIYLNSLITDETDLIFPFATKSDDKIFKRTLNDIIPYSNDFFSALLNNENIKELPDYILTTYLVSQKVITWGLNFNLSDEILCNARNFLNNILKSSDSDFNNLWIAFGEWLARINEPEKFLKIITDQKLQKRLIKFFKVSPDLDFIVHSTEQRLNDKNLDISYLLSKDFSESLKFTKKYAEMGLRFSGPTLYCITYGAFILNRLNQKSLILMLYSISKDLKNLDDTESEYKAKINIFRLILSEIIDYFFSEGLEDIKANLLESDIPFIRAIGSQIVMVFCDIFSENELKSAFSYLNILNNLENLYALAEWVNNVRIKGMNNICMDTPMLNIYDEIRKLWSNVSFDDLKIINTHLNGYNGSYMAKFTTYNLFCPLVNDEKLSIEEIGKLWFSIIFRRLEQAKIKKDLLLTAKDEEFTELLGFFLTKVNSKMKDEFLKEIKNLTTYYIHILIHHFPHADYHNWRNAFLCLLWLQTVLNCARLHEDDQRFKNLADYSEKEIWSYARSELGSELDPLTGIHFISFANDIKQRLSR